MKAVKEKPGFSGFVKKSRTVLKSLFETLLTKFSQEVRTVADEVIRGVRDNFLDEVLEKNKGLKAESEVFTQKDKSFILPRGTRFFATFDDSCVLVIQQNPQVRRISFSGSFFSEDAKNSYSKKYPKTRRKLELAFPYVIFVVKTKGNSIKGLWVFYSNFPITDIGNHMYYPNLPNVNREHNVCMRFPRFEKEASVPLMAETVIEKFWNHCFTDKGIFHYQTMQNQKSDSQFKTVWEWEKASEENPWFVLEARWPVTERTLEFLYHALCKDDMEKFKQRFEGFVTSLLKEFISRAKKAVWDGFLKMEVKNLYSRTIVNIINQAIRDEAKKER